VRTSLPRFLSVLLAIALGGALSGPAAAAVVGPDVAGWQHPNGYTIDWSAAHVAGGAQFAFVKATEGPGYTNAYFARDFAALAANKMARGAYHFAQPATSAVAQARHFVSVTGKLNARGDLPPVLDLEVSGGLGVTALVAWTKAYLTEVKRLTGRTPMVYTSPGFWKSAMGNSTVFTGYPLWIATWGPKPILAGGWTKYTFWQYTDKATLAGMAGPVDMSVFNGTVAELRTLANDAPPPPPAPVAPTAPATLTATPAEGAVALRWTLPTAPGGAIVSYVVTVDGGTPQRLPGTTTTFTAAGLSATAEHRFTVAAVNATGAGPVATVAGTPLAPTPARIALTLTLSATKIRPGRTVTFTGTAGRERAGEKVYRQSWYGRAWHTRATGTVDATGAVALTVRPLATSTSAYRLLITATSRHAAAVSNTVTLRVV
jgi:GH25 family lysozyme M1 (1,4-beta-N-acetylmuramidase)